MSVELKIVEFSNQTREDRKLLKQFVKFHWQHYRDESRYVPLLNYEYLGFRLLGMTGYFEHENLFFKHGEMIFFLAKKEERVVGRCCAFVNHSHNKYWNDRVGFFGQFESLDDEKIAGTLLAHAGEWLKSKGMDTIRGPQNFPINEATPGLLTQGFDSRPVIYYNYNYPYYERLIKNSGFDSVKQIFSWEVPLTSDFDEKMARVSDLVLKKGKVTLETWDMRPLEVRKQEMLSIYNDAWGDNFGFVPFTEEEFSGIIDDMMLILDKHLFVFAFIQNEPAAFFGGVPNIAEKMMPIPGLRNFELLRAAKMLLAARKVKGFRLGYLGVKKKFRHLGLDAALLEHQRQYSLNHGYEYSDVGWVLDDNDVVIKMIGMSRDVKPSKTYTIFQKAL